MPGAGSGWAESIWEWRRLYPAHQRALRVSQQAALQSWRWEVMGRLQKPQECPWAWMESRSSLRMWAGLEVSTAQGKWTPSLSLGRTAQTDQRNLSATELRVTAATQGQEWGQINRGRYPCLWPKYKLKCKKRQRGAPAADTSSVRQPQAISPPTQCHWVLKPPLNKIYEYGGAGQGRATDLETVTF